MTAKGATPDGQAFSPLRMVPLLSLVCLALYLPGIQWGLPGVVSWSQDTIAGVRTLGAVSTWPNEWAGRYPPLQYFLNRAAYEPVLSYWRSKGDVKMAADGQYAFEPPHAPKIATLILASRFISAVMGTGAVILLWLAAKLFTDDLQAAAFAALAFGGGAAFAYFAHLGNVDVPSLYWLGVSLVFYAKSLKGRRLVDAALLGLSGSLCISTKDNWAGLYPGMALMLLAEDWSRLRRDVRQGDSARIANGEFPRGSSPTIPWGPAFVGALLQWRWLIGAFAFIVPYVLLNAIPWNPDGWVRRLQALADAITGDEYRHGNLPALVAESLRQAAGAVGWPMLIALVAACCYGMWTRTRFTLALLVPCATYYGMVIASIGFVYERFLLGPLMLASILLGVMFADCLRTATGPRDSARSALRPKVARWLFVAVFVPSLGYAAAVDLEIIHDSRYEAEQWFQAHVPRSATIGALAGDLEHFAPQYLPRVHEMGYATFPVLAVSESFVRPQPDFLILSEFDRQDFEEDQRECIADLIGGKLGYVPVAEFRGRFLGTKSSWLSVAGWYAPPPGKISPTITVFRKAVLNSE